MALSSTTRSSRNTRPRNSSRVRYKSILFLLYYTMLTRPSFHGRPHLDQDIRQEVPRSSASRAPTQPREPHAVIMLQSTCTVPFTTISIHITAFLLTTGDGCGSWHAGFRASFWRIGQRSVSFSYTLHKHQTHAHTDGKPCWAAPPRAWLFADRKVRRVSVSIHTRCPPMLFLYMRSWPLYANVFFGF